MSDFIFTYPFNGFPFKLDKEHIYNDNFFTHSLSRAEAIQFYWKAYFSDMNFDLNVDIHSSSGDTNIHKNISGDFEIEFMGNLSYVPTTAKERALLYADTYMYSFIHEQEGTTLYFYITKPIYKDEDEYEILFWGGYSFEYDANSFVLYIGKTEITIDYIARYDFSLSIFDIEIPCTFLQRYGYDFGENLVLSASASISSSYIDS